MNDFKRNRPMVAQRERERKLSMVFENDQPDVDEAKDKQVSPMYIIVYAVASGFCLYKHSLMTTTFQEVWSMDMSITCTLIWYQQYDNKICRIAEFKNILISFLLTILLISNMVSLFNECMLSSSKLYLSNDDSAKNITIFAKLNMHE